MLGPRFTIGADGTTVATIGAGAFEPASTAGVNGAIEEVEPALELVVEVLPLALPLPLAGDGAVMMATS